MVQAIVNISEKANRVLNIVKAKYGLRTKSEAIDVTACQYGETMLEPELRPEYIEKALHIKARRAIRVGRVENLRKRHGA